MSDARHPQFSVLTAVAMVVPTTADARRVLKSLEDEGYTVVTKQLLQAVRECEGLQEWDWSLCERLDAEAEAIGKGHP